MTGGIYLITNKNNGNIYIGSAVHIKHRWDCHVSDLNKNKHHSIYLQRAWDKYGSDCFAFSVLEYCEKECLIEREQYYIDTLKPQYNILPKAGSCLGSTRSLETRKKISLSKSGDNCSSETRKKISLSHIGHKPSEETKAKMSASQKGKKRNLGRIATNETKLKMSMARRGEKNYYSKLTLIQVEEIRNRYIPRKVSQRKLAKEYGVDQQVIWSIVNYKTWKCETL